MASQGLLLLQSYLGYINAKESNRLLRYYRKIRLDSKCKTGVPPDFLINKQNACTPLNKSNQILW